jgi:anti-anti-sigma factor
LDGPANFKVKLLRDGSRRVVSATGELDLNTVNVLAEQLTNRTQGGFSKLTLDLRELAFMDSSGLKFLIELNNESKREGWRLALLAPTNEAAALVLRVTGADKALPFERADQP